jgi:hypothetical protein
MPAFQNAAAPQLEAVGSGCDSTHSGAGRGTGTGTSGGPFFPPSTMPTSIRPKTRRIGRILGWRKGWALGRVEICSSEIRALVFLVFILHHWQFRVSEGPATSLAGAC